MVKNGVLAVVSMVFLSGCDFSNESLNKYQETGTYPISAPFREPIAVVVIERNGIIDVASITGSADLHDKQRGIFSTARHVVEMDLVYKLFFCGRVYNARRILDTGVSDIGFLQILGDFNPDSFPDPYPLAQSYSIEDPIFARGIHMHSPEFQEGKILHKIVKDYYELSRDKEFVYDDLPGVLKGDEELMSNSSLGVEDSVRSQIVNNYMMIKTVNDHVESFGGLSGGPVVNIRGQKIGVISNQAGDEGREGVWEYGPEGLKPKPRVTIRLVPLDEVRRAAERLNLGSH